MTNKTKSRLSSASVIVGSLLVVAGWVLSGAGLSMDTVQDLFKETGASGIIIGILTKIFDAIKEK